MKKLSMQRIPTIQMLVLLTVFLKKMNMRAKAKFERIVLASILSLIIAGSALAQEAPPPHILAPQQMMAGSNYKVENIRFFSQPKNNIKQLYKESAIQELDVLLSQYKTNEFLEKANRDGIWKKLMPEIVQYIPEQAKFIDEKHNYNTNLWDLFKKFMGELSGPKAKYPIYIFVVDLRQINVSVRPALSGPGAADVNNVLDKYKQFEQPDPSLDRNMYCYQHMSRFYKDLQMMLGDQNAVMTEGGFKALTREITRMMLNYIPEENAIMLTQFVYYRQDGNCSSGTPGGCKTFIEGFSSFTTKNILHRNEGGMGERAEKRKLFPDDDFTYTFNKVWSKLEAFDNDYKARLRNISNSGQGQTITSLDQPLFQSALQVIFLAILTEYNRNGDFRAFQDVASWAYSTRAITETAKLIQIPENFWNCGKPNYLLGMAFDSDPSRDKSKDIYLKTLYAFMCGFYNGGVTTLAKMTPDMLGKAETVMSSTGYMGDFVNFITDFIADPKFRAKVGDQYFYFIANWLSQRQALSGTTSDDVLTVIFLSYQKELGASFEGNECELAYKVGYNLLGFLQFIESLPATVASYKASINQMRTDYAVASLYQNKAYAVGDVAKKLLGETIKEKVNDHLESLNPAAVTKKTLDEITSAATSLYAFAGLNDQIVRLNKNNQFTTIDGKTIGVFTKDGVLVLAGELKDLGTPVHKGAFDGINRGKAGEWMSKVLIELPDGKKRLIDLHIGHDGKISYEVLETATRPSIAQGTEVFRYTGFGNDIVLPQDRATVVLGRSKDNGGGWGLMLDESRFNQGSTVRKLIPEDDELKTAFHEIDDRKLESTEKLLKEYQDKLPDDPTRGGIRILSVPETVRDRIKEKVRATYPGYSEKQVEEKAWQTFWTRYNLPFLQQAFERGDNVRLVSDPDDQANLSKDGKLTFFGREMRAIRGDGKSIGLAEKHGYTYNEATKTYEKRR